ncbi:ALP1-like protein, partial [Tanacetum coccineum]
MKNVERDFGVLKEKWKIIKYPARGMTRSGLSDIMYTCLILHNMIIHDNGNAISPEFFPEEQHRDDDPDLKEEMFGFNYLYSVILIKRQVETELMIEGKFRDLCEEVSNFVKEIEDVVKEVERLSCKDVAKEIVVAHSRGQKP